MQIRTNVVKKKKMSERQKKKKLISRNKEAEIWFFKILLAFNNETRLLYALLL